MNRCEKIATYEIIINNVSEKRITSAASLKTPVVCSQSECMPRIAIARRLVISKVTSNPGHLNRTRSTHTKNLLTVVYHVNHTSDSYIFIDAITMGG